MIKNNIINLVNLILKLLLIIVLVIIIFTWIKLTYTENSYLKQAEKNQELKSKESSKLFLH